MQVSSNKSAQLFLGIDGGGSKCKAVIMDQNHTVLGTGLAGPANPLHGFEQSIESIQRSTTLALEDANLPASAMSQLIAGVGLAGVNLPKYFDKVNNWQHPFGQMFLTTDLNIACLGAHEGKDGAVIITGTGSCGFSLVNGKQTIVGAHGFPHGDKASGAWIGLQAVQKSLKALDGLKGESVLPEKVLAKLGCHSDVELVEEVAGKNANYYAKLAGLVFDCAAQGDQLARDIILDGAEYVGSVVKRLGQAQPPRISMIGGLTRFFADWLDDDVKSQLSPVICPPEIGAVLFAHQQLSQS